MPYFILSHLSLCKFFFKKNTRVKIMEEMQPNRRPPGRPKRGNRVKKFTIMLPPEVHTWAMEQPEGVSALVRQLLQDEQARRTRQSRRRQDVDET